MPNTLVVVGLPIQLKPSLLLQSARDRIATAAETMTASRL